MALSPAVESTEGKTQTRALPRFQASSPFRTELNAAVDEYFKGTGLSPREGPRMALKTAIIVGWTVASYALLVFWATTWWTAVPLAVSLGLAMAGIGFSIQHDGGHAAYSTSKRVNKWAAASLDMIGGSSFVWNFKHNVLHHTYPNVEDADDDIEFTPFLRLSKGQPRHWFHRFQFLYWPPLFFFLSTKWIFLDDYIALARGTVAGHPMPKPKASDLLLLFGGKLFFIAWAIVIPLLVVDPVHYLLGYALVSAVLGSSLGLVFQLAHCVEDAEFFAPVQGETLPLPWAEHQLATTVDFARGNPLVTWYVGGLNHQVEHHLFPRVGHHHYRALAEIVRDVAARHGVTHKDHPSMYRAIRAHVRHLYLLGLPEPATASA